MILIAVFAKFTNSVLEDDMNEESVGRSCFVHNDSSTTMDTIDQTTPLVIATVNRP